MAKNVRIIGVDNIVAKLNKETKQINNKSTKGLINCSIIIRRAMDKEEPLIPLATGNLRASWFATPLKGVHPLIVMGFTANYAVEVHESNKSYKRPGSGYLFFEKAIEHNYEKIIQAIKNETRI